MGVCFSQRSEDPQPQLILCYGDSLTAGTSPQEVSDTLTGEQLFPYAPALENALREKSFTCNATVKHRGLPGWTCQHMLRSADEEKSGLRDFIQSNKDPGMVVILAGTNDLAYIGSAKPVVECLTGLHNLSLEAGVPRTVAIGIPPSAYQTRNKEASDLCHDVNEAIKAFCDENPRCTFIPFPFEFQWDSRWSPDGLHLTKEGYHELGRQIEPMISEALK